MFSALPALLAVLALAGAPRSTSVVCNPQIPATELGVTYSSTATIVDGKVVMGTLDEIQLGPLACGGILYASVDRRTRAAIRRLNPTVDFTRLLGVGLQVALHEANHVALNSQDECLVEKTARSEINGLIERYADPGTVAEAERDATASDAALPPEYHC